MTNFQKKWTKNLKSFEITTSYTLLFTTINELKTWKVLKCVRTAMINSIIADELKTWKVLK